MPDHHELEQLEDVASLQADDKSAGFGNMKAEEYACGTQFSN